MTSDRRPILALAAIVIGVALLYAGAAQLVSTPRVHPDEHIYGGGGASLGEGDGSAAARRAVRARPRVPRDPRDRPGRRRRPRDGVPPVQGRERASVRPGGASDLPRRATPAAAVVERRSRGVLDRHPLLDVRRARDDGERVVPRVLGRALGDRPRPRTSVGGSAAGSARVRSSSPTPRARSSRCCSAHTSSHSSRSGRSCRTEHTLRELARQLWPTLAALVAGRRRARRPPARHRVLPAGRDRRLPGPVPRLRPARHRQMGRLPPGRPRAVPRRRPASPWRRSSSRLLWSRARDGLTRQPPRSSPPSSPSTPRCCSSRPRSPAPSSASTASTIGTSSTSLRSG